MSVLNLVYASMDPVLTQKEALSALAMMDIELMPLNKAVKILMNAGNRNLCARVDVAST
jgi:hypothetical protein